MSIAEIFRKIRDAHGLSQSKMAEAMETTQGTISNIEKGVNANPTYELVKRLIFNVGANPLFVFGIDTDVDPVMHPSILKDRLHGKKSTKIKVDLIDRIEKDLAALKSLKD